MSTPSQPHKRKRNLTRTLQPPSIPWDKSLRTKSYPSSMQSSRNSLKTRKTTPQEKRKNNSNPNLNRNPILTTMMRTKVIGDPMISWSEESISWKRRKKPRMMMKSQASKNRNQNTFIKRMKRRRKSSTCPKIIKRKRSKLSQSSRLKPKSRTLSALSTSWPLVTKERSIWTTWTKSSTNPRITKTLKSFLSFWSTFQSELKFSDKWSSPTSPRTNGQPFTTTSTSFTTS